MIEKIEPVQDVKRRRDAVLSSFVDRVPFLKFMGITFDRRGNELTGIMNFDPKLIGNPVVERLHGGGTASFLESAAIITLAWKNIWDAMEAGEIDLENLEGGALPPLPKTIDLTIDYLRPGLPRDAYARATVNRSGRRYASVHVEAWQDRREVLFAQATGHFLMPYEMRP
ncbi:thioesterase [Amylibacter ulvae]|uniref:Thioesterase n=1 Tax=Paramylibacter ulvae TaxID=1651968 RepID=A0ABQ3D4V8_9RHOB|nr:acyl-CoA thioesterase domain-containing protein [Amylibacter ulvae]GHA57665.1 thioesterase [Amylibacter ulvae]